ncbi:SigE family RNA polymerase sigma factor [Micromonospora lutea]|uniref:RNA polymerase n=1 Tax=Micromonospora lutea TaxID=419825 RepID=A0ABQ4IU33_9ACTN|nr:SigE family RNA polymerase sigma factor [Micromonospora lutea]GIJ21138.1 RNA polymerase [Micromonospora lutea]
MTDRYPAPPEGFADFVAARSGALLRSAWLLTGDAGRAEDLLQTVLTTAWRRWPTVVAAGHPEAYLRRALFTTYVSWWRRRWRTEFPAATPPDNTGPGDLARESADRDAVRRALARLSRQQRAIVVLRYAEDLSVERTAQVLGCSPNTVKVQSSRALRSLRTDPDLSLFTNREVVP